MSQPTTLNVALKEWAAVIEAIAAGRPIVLLRKGGIYESAGGFEIEHRTFLLFPTYVHQNAEMLKDEALVHFQPYSAEPSQIRLDTLGQITHIIPIASRQQVDALSAEHVWERPLIDMRFNYKPQNPLYLLLVRAWRLPEPVQIANTPAYGGCKSWVRLDQAIDVSAATAVLDDTAYAQRAGHIVETLSSMPL